MGGCSLPSKAGRRALCGRWGRPLGKTCWGRAPLPWMKASLPRSAQPSLWALAAAPAISRCCGGAVAAAHSGVRGCLDARRPHPRRQGAAAVASQAVRAPPARRAAAALAGAAGLQLHRLPRERLKTTNQPAQAPCKCCLPPPPGCHRATCSSASRVARLAAAGWNGAPPGAARLRFAARRIRGIRGLGRGPGGFWGQAQGHPGRCAAPCTAAGPLLAPACARSLVARTVSPASVGCGLHVGCGGWHLSAR
jgi:hypothetical protein